MRKVRARPALGWCQILLTLAIAWAAWTISDSLPYWRALLSTSPWRTFGLDLIRCVCAILPPALLWGASFPLAIGAVASPGEDPGRVVGGIYAANTFGAIVGALGVSLALIPWVGTLDSQRVLLLLAAVGALLVLAPYAWERRSSALAIALAHLDGDRRPAHLEDASYPRRSHRLWTPRIAVDGPGAHPLHGRGTELLGRHFSGRPTERPRSTLTATSRPPRNPTT